MQSVAGSTPDGSVGDCSMADMISARIVIQRSVWPSVLNGHLMQSVAGSTPCPVNFFNPEIRTQL